MDRIPLVLMVFSFVCFVLSCFQLQSPTWTWNRLVSAGLAFWSFVIVLGYSGILGK